MKKLILGLISVSLVACSAAGSQDAQTATAENTAPIKVAANSSKPSRPVVVEAPNYGSAFEATPSGEYVIEKGHAYINASYLHQGFSRPILRWLGWDSTLNWNAEDPTQSSVIVTMDAASVDSGIAKFDEHLKAADFFDVENFPTITFQSIKLEKRDGLTGQMTGDLTIKGITKPVYLNVVFNKGALDFWDNTRLGFSAKGQIMRSDWGLGKYSPATSDLVDLVIEVEYIKK